MLMDASAVVDLFLASANSPRIRQHIASNSLRLYLSDFAVGEFASAVKRERSVRNLSDADIRSVFIAFDTWRSANAEPVPTEAADVRAAAALMRRLDLALRMHDAIYVVTAQRLFVPLCSFDRRQITAARLVGVDVVNLD